MALLVVGLKESSAMCMVTIVLGREGEEQTWLDKTCAGLAHIED